MLRSEREQPKDKRKKSSSNCCSGILRIMIDPRQIVAGLLTITMFITLAHMIKRDHFDNHSQVKLSTPQNGPFEGSKFAEETVDSVATGGGLWGEDAPELKPCWSKPSTEDSVETEGFVTFSLTDGPEYHIAQIADAVVVAKSIGATLVLPDIRGTQLGDERNFDDVYDADKFMKSLDGVVKVVKQPTSKITAKNLAVVKVPNRVNEDHIAAHIEPVFRQKGNIRLVTHFPSVNMKKAKKESDLDSLACMAMFGTLELQPEIRGVVDSMVERLRTLSRKSEGRFVAVDLRVDVLEKKGCQEDGGSGPRSCYDAREIAVFLKKVGYSKDTTIYLTQSRWDSSLDALKEFFPRTYTKEGIMPMDKRQQYLDPEAPTMEEVIDFYICSESDVFVPAISGLFYANVAGKRITSGKTQILVPADISTTSASPEKYLSHYVTKKNHLAYSCFC